MTVYIDIILLENLCMNYIILFATAYIMKIKISHIRIIASSSIGAVYSIMLYMQILPIYSSIFMKIILSVAMVYISYAPKTVKIAIKQLIIFYLISFAFGGCAFALLYFVKPQDIFIKNGVYIGTYPLKIALLGGIVGFIITYIAFKIIKNKATKEEMIYKLKIKINDKTVEVNALLDTGNKLKDPITLVPVIVIEKQKLYNFLPEEILENIDKIIGGDSDKLIEENIKYMSKFRVIPYNSIGKQNGLMLGFKADEVKIIIDEEERTIKNTIIGIFNQSFNSQTYSALISLEIIE
ncbi:MAG: sigma-E processing peptidase SpoIIGA [Clostridia bacterium]|nr:sigma-E processing peptidase SpoIIGA [Clostridiales bacterium]